MATAAEQIDTIINNAIATAADATTNVSDAADQIMAEARGAVTSIWAPLDLPVPDAVEPDMPEVTDGTVIFDRYKDQLIGDLTNNLADYFATYYPLDSDAFDEAQAWLKDVINNGGTGIPAALEDQIWQRSRDRLTNEASMAQSQILSAGAARGMPLVDGATVNSLKEIQLKKLQEAGQQSTLIATKQVEIEIETIKFAIEQAVKSRFAAMNAAGDYIRAIASGIGSAIEVGRLNANAKAVMMDAVATLYRARLSRDEIIINSQVSKRSQDRTHFVDLINDYHATISARVDAATNAANAFAKTAQAALNSLQTVASNANASFS